MIIKPKPSRLAPYVVDLEEGSHIWCGCGLSREQPFCDNAHKGTEFEGQDRVAMLFETETDKTVALCGCKETKNPPFCDGAHKSL
ncbi:MAG: CDGSH iron-sulfur domain-containing protein [Nitrospinota bacterium]|nr:CDGSH iron-sulfur domain-containing protein [Nitrospinota bacterium]MDH5756897.1 CDGSH iron-sulfur domain-containing protein [Nitrospinota bacterium]